MLFTRIGVGGFLMAAVLSAASGVTAVRLRMVPAKNTGPCPGRVQLVGEISTDGPGTVWYQFLAGAVSNSPEGTLSFSEAGTKTVTLEGRFREVPQVPHASLIAIMQDAEGRHGPQNETSGPVDYNITCGGPLLLHLPEGTTVNAQYEDGTQASFRPPEQVALVFVVDIRILESDTCADALHRFCSLEELVKGVKDKEGQAVGFKSSPLEDPAYRYTVTLSDRKYQIEAAPLLPGLGGFLLRGAQYGPVDFYYNSTGAATANDKKLAGHGFDGDDFIAR